MLNDTHRNGAYFNAIRAAIQRRQHALQLEGGAPDDGVSVLDIGAGTGLLSMMAVRVGAKHVVACEMNPVMCAVARDCIKVNGMSHQIKLVAAKSTQLYASPLGEQEADKEEKICSEHAAGVDGSFGGISRVDVIVTELCDAGVLGEGIIPVLRHAQANFLKPGGIIISHSAQVFACLVESENVRRKSCVDIAGLEGTVLHTDQ
jgi:type II protein arginine methyltransferase